MCFFLIITNLKNDDIFQALIYLLLKIILMKKLTKICFILYNLKAVRLLSDFTLNSLVILELKKTVIISMLCKIYKSYSLTNEHSKYNCKRVL